jgi:hypothetical protein
MTTDIKDEHPQKQFSPIEFTELGMVNDSKEEHD